MSCTDRLVDVLKLQLRLIDRGYVVEAQRLEQFKSDVHESASEFNSADDKQHEKQQVIAQLEHLLKVDGKKNKMQFLLLDLYDN